MGSYAREPADISQAEWDQQRGELLRLSGVVGTLSAQVAQQARDLESLAKRQAKHSDWRDTTGRHDLELLQKELAKYDAENARRVALWVKIALIIFGAIASGLIGHFAK